MKIRKVNFEIIKRNKQIISDSKSMSLDDLAKKYNYSKSYIKNIIRMDEAAERLEKFHGN